MTRDREGLLLAGLFSAICLIPFVLFVFAPTISRQEHQKQQLQQSVTTRHCFGGRGCG
ncbi:MAG: hypothetical protein KBC81_02815 [Candidatus Pacebacteria bacterium]|nr:hypothetical protein [Candidatus Paceibacterota bacterium]